MKSRFTFFAYSNEEYDKKENNEGKKISCKCQGVAFIASGSKKISSGLKLLNKYCCFFLLIKFKNITNNWLKHSAVYLRPSIIKIAE